MRKIDFNVIPIGMRIVEFKNTHDTDIIKYALQRTVSLSDEELEQVEIEFSIIRRTIKIKTTASIVIRIIDSFAKIRLDTRSITNNEVIVELNEYFRKMI